MNWLATWLARRTWFYTLSWMRRPWMRRIHMAPLKWLPERRHEKFLRSYQDQNRLARRIGLPMLKWTYILFLAVLAFQVTYSTAIAMVERGWLSPPSLENRRVTAE